MGSARDRIDDSASRPELVLSVLVAGVDRSSCLTLVLVGVMETGLVEKDDEDAGKGELDVRSGRPGRCESMTE